MFQDLQCPFCGKSWQTLLELDKIYGRERLRIVYKHFPLPFHDEALPSGRVAQAVFELKGAEAFRIFVSKVFELHGNMDDNRLRALANSGGISSKSLDDLVLDQKSVAWKKLDDDAVLARMLNVQGTPHFFINGARIVGAQPIEAFRRIIDAELLAAQELHNAGTKAQDIFAVRVKVNLALEPEEERVAEGAPGAAPADNDSTVYNVPVDQQPVEGPNDAPVTIVEFVDYECPFCRQVEGTREQLLKKYGRQLRFVVRHNPLPFHPRALPAVRLAIEAFKEKGNPAFWATHRRLLESENLDDAKLLAIADSLKLDHNRAKHAVEAPAYQEILDGDAALAVALKATGTPHFFVNGIRVSGAQPADFFERVIDAQLAKSSELLKSGIPASAIYATLMKRAVRPDPFEHKSVPLPTPGNPQRGATTAPVVIDAFIDFQCPFCSRLTPILSELQREFPGKLRIVYRSRPLPFHDRARPAAEAALEAFRQRGNAGFWKMFDRLFEVQSTHGAFELPELERYAKEQGLDVQQFRNALNEHEHEREIAADEVIADHEDISGTPACVINGIYISGAQPVASFKQAVRAALQRH
jgi:protein-disulfide isomerase